MDRTFGKGAAVLADAATDIVISNPYARATPPGMKNSAVFLAFENKGKMPHAVVSAVSGLQVQRLFREGR